MLQIMCKKIWQFNAEFFRSPKPMDLLFFDFLFQLSAGFLFRVLLVGVTPRKIDNVNAHLRVKRQVWGPEDVRTFSKYFYYNIQWRAIVGPRHLNSISLVGRKWPALLSLLGFHLFFLVHIQRCKV